MKKRVPIKCQCGHTFGSFAIEPELVSIFVPACPDCTLGEWEHLNAQIEGLKLDLESKERELVRLRRQ